MGSSEFELIEWIRSTRPSPAGPADAVHRLETGIGDDCAVVRTRSGDGLLLATDLVIEGVHFDLASATPEEVGWKALAVNLSDVAAMGGQPTMALVAAALPGPSPGELLRGIYQGMDAVASRFGIAIVGGDLSASPASLVLAVSILGDAGPAPSVRSAALPGDAILVTGELGGSRLGHHLHFLPRVGEGRRLVSHHGVRAMIDVSDGLLQDLGRILTASGVGAILEEARIPVSADARRMAERSGRTALDHALRDGEDFELLFTASSQAVPFLLLDPDLGAPVHVVGEVVEEPGLWLLDAGGRRIRIDPEGGGHDHFRA